MRSRLTNILQIIVLIVGIIYIVAGLFFYVSPLTVIEVFAQNISENWIDLVKDHELVGPMYFIFRAIAALLFTSGLAMVMPLFDPLKYRGLIYYNAVIFPVLASFMLIKNGLFMSAKHKQVMAIASDSVVMKQQGHLLVIILGVIFSVIAIVSMVGLFLTREQAKEGME